MSLFPDLCPPSLDAQLLLRSLGSAHIGGRSASLEGMPLRQVTFTPGAPIMTLDPNGEFEIEQMYVQFAQLQRPRARHPLLLMHGGGMCGVAYETRPDGQPGWQDFFLRAGHDVWLADAVERGRASWARSPEFFQGEPVFRSKQEAWELFRLGPPGSWHADAEHRTAYKPMRFPVAAFDKLMKQSVPRWTSNDAVTQAAYNDLALQHGPFVLIAHSQGCNFAFGIALAFPEKVRAIVAVEPSGFPQVPDSQLAGLQGIPHLMLWGDHLQVDHPLWPPVRQALKVYAKRLREQGVSVDDWELPAMGQHGNSHLIMMDDNAIEVATGIHQWLGQQGLLLDVRAS